MTSEHYRTNSLIETISRKYGEFERFNEREIRKIALPLMKNSEFSVTGRLVSGLIGFTVIVLVLSISFAHAASSTDVTPIGGVNAYLAQINSTQEQLLSQSGFFDEGQTLTFDVTQDSMGSDLKEIRNMGMISVQFYFESPSITDQTQPTVSIRIANGSEGMELYTDTQNSYEHTWQYDFMINNLTSSGNVTMAADSEEDFVLQLEVDGEYIFVEVVYEDSNAIVGFEDDTLDYEINITMTTWSIENINEVQEV